jgi:hypothetical protein
VLADDAYWLVHDDWTGRPRTSHRAAGLAVAAAVLGELIAGGALVAVRGRIAPAGVSPVPPDETVARDVFTRIVEERDQHPIGDWLDFLAPTVVDQVGRRMLRAGTARSQVQGLWGRRAVILPVDPGRAARAAWVFAGLVAAVREGRTLDPWELFLLRLATAGSLRHQLFADVHPKQARAALDQLDNLWPPWVELLTATDRAIAAAALTRTP